MTDHRARRVLVVDDEVLIAMLLTDMLEELGCEVVGPALHLDAAMALAREAPIDWAVLDLNLGGQPSFPVAQVLRDRNIPFVFASGYGSVAAGSGFETVTAIQKPFNLSEIAAALHAFAPQ